VRPTRTQSRGRDPGCCLSEYLDQPVAPYTVDEPLHDGQIVQLGDADWQVVRTPGHTPGHLALWQTEEQLLVVGDALSDYDVGWVNLALDGPDAAGIALASLQRMAELTPRVLLPAHGPIPGDAGAALATAMRRARGSGSPGAAGCPRPTRTRVIRHLGAKRWTKRERCRSSRASRG